MILVGDDESLTRSPAVAAVEDIDAVGALRSALDSTLDGILNGTVDKVVDRASARLYHVSLHSFVRYPAKLT